ncbi:metal-dependent hydrolase [Paenibacillus thermoaerophilus]|uniref:Metal-dependent hydrolase n=1 Tax=Paenibacillus thermoaerophilus TaxID=1215385 RepID=A0ABW2V6A5_9BACL|nr:metal-dependent hydrolase [Paenibacillus thermoaerophilus]TMV17133.1 metal-dependent hydrolase [Paenibacillus thermoaerophilus]
MDTGSHLIFGLTLAGLAWNDPAVSSDPNLALAVGTAAVLGSNAPDADGIARLRGRSFYVRHHRGWSHAWPSWFAWAALIAVPVSLIFGVPEHAGKVYGWTFAAVALHVLLDALNAYGVQCLRPFSRRWVHLDALPLFDPVIAAVHLAGLAGWIFGLPPGPVFAGVYAATFGYAGVRWAVTAWLQRRVPAHIGLAGRCMIVPGLWLRRWQFVIETDRAYVTGHAILTRSGRPAILVRERYEKSVGEDHEVIRSTLQTDGVRAFLGFAQYVYVRWAKSGDGYEVQWRDVRFWNDRELPFGVDVQLDRDLKVVRDRIGWNKRYWEAPYV